MNICSDNHEEIVYIGRYCPLCDVASELDDAKDQIKKLKEKLEKELEESTKKD